MMIVMKETATDDEIAAVVEKIERAGARAHRSSGARVTVIGAIGDVEQDASVESLGLEGQPGVDRVVPILKPYKLASAQIRHGERTVLDIEGRKVGGGNFALIAGPCTVETREQTLETARVVRDAGATLLRGGAYKPRTSPYAFQGLGQEGLRLLAEAKAETGLPVVTELMDLRDLDPVLEVADVIQIGARNMQNYPLLTEIGRSGRPALLKRGLSAPLDELLMAAEYILKEGNPDVMLCERGIRTFDTAYRRTTLDLMAVPILKELSHLPVIVDPSHAAGRRDLVLSLSLAAAAAGADGLIVEVHPSPDEALCDGPQSLPTDTFAEYAVAVERAAALAGKALSAVGWSVAGRSAHAGCSSAWKWMSNHANFSPVRAAAVRPVPGCSAPRGPPVEDRDPRGGADRRLDRAGRPWALGGARLRLRPRPTGVRAGARAGGRGRDGAGPRHRGDGSRVRIRGGSGGDARGDRPRGARTRRPRVRRERRGVDQACVGRRSAGPALRRWTPPHGGRDLRRRARPRGPVRGRHVVPHADGAHRCGAVRAPARADRAPWRAARGDRARRPRPPDGVRLTPSARARQRARGPGCGGL